MCNYCISSRRINNRGAQLHALILCLQNETSCCVLNSYHPDDIVSFFIQPDDNTQILVLLQNVPRQNVPLQNDPIQKVPALKRPSYKRSQPQNVPSHKTYQASKRPNPKRSQPQKVPATKRPKPQNVPAPEGPISKTSQAPKIPKSQNVPLG